MSETGEWKQGREWMLCLKQVNGNEAVSGCGSEWMLHLKQVNGNRGVSGCCV